MRDEFHVVVTDCGDGTWEWEICRRGEPLAVRMRDGPFKSQEIALAAGKADVLGRLRTAYTPQFGA